MCWTRQADGWLAVTFFHEFGAKIGASIVEGYTFIDHHSRDAYNESPDLLLQIQLFKERFGYLPATILADKIYLNRANRDILEDFEIHSYCKPLGRPPKDPPSDEMKSRMAKAIGERNENRVLYHQPLPTIATHPNGRSPHLYMVALTFAVGIEVDGMGTIAR